MKAHILSSVPLDFLSFPLMVLLASRESAKNCRKNLHLPHRARGISATNAIKLLAYWNAASMAHNVPFAFSVDSHGRITYQELPP